MKNLNDLTRPPTGGRARWHAAFAGMLLALVWCGTSRAKEADWIWTPAHANGEVPERASCCFRKTFTAEAPIRVQATIAADDEYELYINGQKVGTGTAFRKFDEYNISSLVKAGRNTIAVQVTNRRGPTAALALRVLLRERDGGWVTHSTDQTWLTTTAPQGTWQNSNFDDRDWEPAQVFGPLGDTAPWDRDADVATTPKGAGGRFQAPRDFEVQRVIDADVTGSLIAMAFNEFGHLIVSREGGGLALIVDTDGDGIVDDLRPYGDAVTNVQGILPINGDVYVTGTGPDGCGLYCLSDLDRDGHLDTTRLLFKFEGETGEHAAHGLALGPDGWIYVVLGNHTSPLVSYDVASPHRGYYEGDLVGPRYEDPGGHAAGRKAPGGVIIRTNLQGTTVELVAGGLRNAYDLVFNGDGEIFVHDSDMESDLGTTWYRPTRLCHVVPGGEYGWRSGWAKWPDYYIDSLPAIADTGRSSPTGAVFYTHTAYPAEYRQALFLGDWSEGRILVAHLKRYGASYRASVETFLTGQPLNVTDLDVSPDGWLYFVTGGRGTGGGVYRVVYQKEIVGASAEPGSGIAAAIRQPHLESAWGRQQVARIRQQLRADWGPMLVGVARSTTNPTHYRTRALDLMQLYGPPADLTLLLELSRDPNETIRARAADALALVPSDEAHQRLLDLVDDSDRYVRRKALEGLVRAEQTAPPDLVIPLLASDDRVEAWAARRVLETSPVERWRDTVLGSSNQRIVIQGALALLIAQPTREHALLVLDRAGQLMNDFVSDRDFVDLLRVIQVALMQGQIAPDQVDGLRRQLAEEFPAGDPLMNRELIRLLVYLQEGSIMDRYLEYLNSDVSHPDKVHVALYLRFLSSGWTLDDKEQLFRLLQEAKGWEGGSSYPLYLGNAARDFARQLTLDESVEILRQGDQWPDAALGALYALPRQLDADMRAALIQLDEKIDARQDAASRQLMVGIVAVLARSGDDDAMAYLRTIWDRNPERREPVAMGLAQRPGGENWSYLVHSLPVLENQTAREVLRQLATVDQYPEEPEDLRQLILCGLRLGDSGATDALALLEHWAGESLGDPSSPWQDRLHAWQVWFAEAFPDMPAATLPVDVGGTPWKYEELLEFISGKEGQAGDPARGALVFEKATCIKCHRYGDRGEAMGPDLTSLNKRFTRKEILQSILYPSHVISSQYVSQNVLLTDGRQLLGIVAPGGQGEKIVLNSEGEKIPVREEEIDEITPSPLSAMPDGLIKDLTLAEIADLFAYVSTDPAASVAERPTPALNTGAPREARPAPPLKR